MATKDTDKMEIFAYDVFVHTMSLFETTTAISPPKWKANNYEHSDFFRVLSRGYISYQLLKRDIWKPKFEAEFKSNGLKKQKQIEEFLKALLKEMDLKPRKPVGRIISSLALINELIQFLYSKNSRLFFKTLPSLWRDYFSSFEEDFEKEGGLSYLYSIHAKYFQVLNDVIDFFLSSVSLEYGMSDVSLAFIHICTDPSFMNKIKQNIDRTSANAMDLFSSFGGKLSIATRSPRTSGKKPEASESLENPGLGIIPHEKLRDSHYTPDEKETSEENPTEENLTTDHTNVTSCRKQCEQKSPKQEKLRRQPYTITVSPERWSKDQSSLTGSPLSPGDAMKILDAMTRSPLSPEGRSKGRGSPASLPLSPEERSKDRDGPAGSPLSPGGPLKILSALTGSPLSPEGRSKNRGSLTGSPLSPERPLDILSALTRSPLSPEERLKNRGILTGSPLSPEGPLKILSALTRSPLSPEERSKGRCSPEGRSKDRDSPAGSPLSTGSPLKILSAMTGSPLDPEGQLKDGGSPTISPLISEGRLTRRGALADSPSSPQEQTHRRGSRTPVGISRLEQKRQKYMQPKKPEPIN